MSFFRMHDLRGIVSEGNALGLRKWAEYLGGAGTVREISCARCQTGFICVYLRRSLIWL